MSPCQGALHGRQVELGGDTRVPELRGGAGPVTQPVQAAEGQLTYIHIYISMYILTVSTYLHSLYLELVSLHLGRISPSICICIISILTTKKKYIYTKYQ